MAPETDRYSKAISWLKVVLPIVGLGILSTLFLVAREARIDQRRLPPEAVAPDGGFETASMLDYSGITGDGSAVSIVADRAWPAADGSGRLEGSGIVARFDLRGDETAEVRAESGSLRPEGDILALRGDVVVTTDSGWIMESDALDASLDWTRLTSPVAVRTQGPMGTLTADQMVIDRGRGAEGSYLMEFDGDVHLVYRP